MYDFIAIIPFHWIIDMTAKRGNHRWNTLFLIKIIRIRKVNAIFNVQLFMTEVKKISYSRLERMIEHDPDLAENQDIDNNNIELLMKIGYGLKTLKLAIVIFNISYFMGIIWLIYCDFTRDPEFFEKGKDPDFIAEYELGHRWDGDLVSDDNTSNSRKAITVIYFSFTSLSTVGFGDYTPKTDSERLLCAMVLLFGNMIFSLVMEQFLGILNEVKELENDLDEGDQLSKFFGLIQRFNKGKLIPITLQTEIQEYFDYRWENDKNAAINDEVEVALLTQLPQDTQDRLLNGFLFKDFIRIFRLFFRIIKDSQFFCPPNVSAHLDGEFDESKIVL